MERLIMEMVETLRQQQQQQPSPPIPVPPPGIQDHQAEDRTITLTKEFKKMKPPSFKEGIEPMKAEAWVLGIEKLFKVFPCTEAQKVQLAAFTLEDEAQRWWMLTRTVHQGLAWDRFLELFYDKYFPQNYKKERKFEGGLRPSILDQINMLKLPIYVDVLGRAVIAEGACFKCDKTGHLARECPQRNRQNGNKTTASSAGSTPTPTTKATTKLTSTKDIVEQVRVFVLVLGDVQNAEAMVSGTFSITNHSAHVLFDSGSTHSFVSKAFARHRHRPM
ncbi:uncharacterized protein LOC114293412 [Camellia sinensis]|uniref:uncharacterized protein LOC114293412 n=1 Tax=Camellia sinensis TaxID=4442 RepID=UPI00103694BD|nr:uncharacterized protein LOC114293412 [Camellia sinensis]